MRRSLEFVEPYKRDVVSAFVFVTVSTLCTVAGPLLVKFATDRGSVEGQRCGAQRSDHRLLRGGWPSTTVVGRQQFLAINTAGEGFLRDLRVRGVRPAAGPVDGVLRPQQGGACSWRA